MISVTRKGCAPASNRYLHFIDTRSEQLNLLLMVSMEPMTYLQLFGKTSNTYSKCCFLTCNVKPAKMTIYAL